MIPGVFSRVNFELRVTLLVFSNDSVFQIK